VTVSFSKEFLEKTIVFWQPYSREPLTLEDAREICENLTAFAKLLIDLDRKYGASIDKKAT